MIQYLRMSSGWPGPVQLVGELRPQELLAVAAGAVKHHHRIVDLAGGVAVRLRRASCNASEARAALSPSRKAEVLQDHIAFARRPGLGRAVTGMPPQPDGGAAAACAARAASNASIEHSSLQFRLERIEQRKLAWQHQSRAPRQGPSSAPSATSGKLWRRPLRGGHSTSNSIAADRRRRRDRPRARKLRRSFRPPGAPSHSGNGAAFSASPDLFLEFAQRRFERGASPGSTMPLGIIQAPTSLFRQNGPPGLISSTSMRAIALAEQEDAGAMRRRHSGALLGRDGLRDPSAAEQARAVIGNRRLPWRNAIFAPGEANPFAVATRRNRRAPASAP